MAGIVGTITNLSDFLSKTQVCLSVKPNDPQQQIICLEADRKYSIPAFQREVRWDDNNLKMLLYDLSRSSKFLGNIILTIKSDHTCEIIDGQQRMTVFIPHPNSRRRSRKLRSATEHLARRWESRSVGWCSGSSTQKTVLRRTPPSIVLSPDLNWRGNSPWN